MTRPVVLALAVLAASTPRTVEAQDTEWNRYTLEGLPGVHVRMEVAEACEAAGLTASEFEAEVSLALMNADVGVLTQEEMLELPALPELRVTLDCAEGSNGSGGSMAYSVGLRLQQSAQMIRDTQITLSEAVTWYSTEIGVADPDSAVPEVQATLSDQIDGFITAWTEINSSDEGGR